MPVLWLLWSGGWSSFSSVGMRVEDRPAHIIEYIFVRAWPVTLPALLLLASGMHLLVTAAVTRHRLLLNFTVAVFITWVLVGLIVGLFLMAQM